jgi:hypothetical protein
MAGYRYPCTVYWPETVPRKSVSFSKFCGSPLYDPAMDLTSVQIRGPPCSKSHSLQVGDFNISKKVSEPQFTPKLLFQFITYVSLFFLGTAPLMNHCVLSIFYLYFIRAALPVFLHLSLNSGWRMHYMSCPFICGIDKLVMSFY